MLQVTAVREGVRRGSVLHGVTNAWITLRAAAGRREDGLRPAHGTLLPAHPLRPTNRELRGVREAAPPRMHGMKFLPEVVVVVVVSLPRRPCGAGRGSTWRGKAGQGTSDLWGAVVTCVPCGLTSAGAQ